MTARVRRATRLVELGEKAEQSARVRASAAERALSDARDDARGQENAWSEAARDFATGIKRVTELQEQAAHLETLRRRADAAARRVERAIADERACATELVRTATERRKLELWRDRIIDANRAEEARLERIASDELASRVVSRGQS